jgi:hypothetical protein
MRWFEFILFLCVLFCVTPHVLTHALTFKRTISVLDLVLTALCCVEYYCDSGSGSDSGREQWQRYWKL